MVSCENEVYMQSYYRLNPLKSIQTTAAGVR